jgi:branched-chain amino acid transport system ATP-binding protein
MLLEIEDLVVGYESAPILKGVDLAIEEESIVGVIGPNGAGKSTLFKTIMGYLTPWEGSVRFRGEDISGRDPSELVQDEFGYVPQTNNVFPKMDVHENLRMGGYTIDNDVLEDQLEYIYGLFPLLDERRSQTVKSMSGGEQKLVAVARAMMTEPEIILFDEPSAGLMPKFTDMVFQKMAEINESEGVCFLVIEQDIQKILENTQETFVLRNGEVQLNKRSEELIDDPELAETYLGGTSA